MGVRRCTFTDRATNRAAVVLLKAAAQLLEEAGQVRPQELERIHQAVTTLAASSFSSVLLSSPI